MSRVAPRHFLDLSDFEAYALRQLIDDAYARKNARRGFEKGRPDPDKPLSGKVLALIFEIPSTRTRVSFDIAMRQLGGQAVLLQSKDLQLGRGETVSDTARVLSRYIDGIMLRTDNHDKLLELAMSGTVPVINGLTNKTHPCQLMADILTFEEHKGPIKDRVIAWTGDGNNVAATWIHAAGIFDFELRLACPDILRPDKDVLAWANKRKARVYVTRNPCEAVDSADCVVTDTWVSMSNHAGTRHELLAPYQVNDELMACAHKDAIFMHCLPAHRGEEVSESVIDGPQSVVFDSAENRLHAQKSILLWCMGERSNL